MKVKKTEQSSEAKRENERARAWLKREGSEADISAEHRRAGDAWNGRVHFVWKDVNGLLCRGDDGAFRLMKVNERNER